MLSTLALLLTLVPQGEVRGSGRVVDHLGEPVANATVTFLSRPIPRALDATPEDRRVVQTDQRGAFRVELARDTRYSVWAGWDRGATQAQEGVAGGEFLELRGVGKVEPIHVELVGTEEWPEADSFRLRAIVGTENIDFAELQRTDDGTWRLPALPPKGQRTIEVLDARGEVLWADEIVRGKLQLPPPRERIVEVVDENGDPIAGVDILWHIRNYWYSESGQLFWGDRFRALWPNVGKTDEQGRLTTRVPHGQGRTDFWLLAVREGYAMSLDGIEDGARFSNGKVLAGDAAADEGPIRITLRKAAKATVPLFVGDGTPLADQWLHVVCRVFVWGESNGSGTPLNLTLPVRNGVAHLTAPLPPKTDFELAEFVLSKAASQRLAKQHGFSPDSTWQLTQLGELFEAGAQEQIAFDGLRVLQVSAADGRPASRAAVLVHDQTTKKKTLRRTDRLGRVLLAPGAGRHIGIVEDGGIGALRLDAESNEPVMLQLQEMVPITIRVVDSEGEPVAGAAVRVRAVKNGDDPELLWCVTTLMPLRPAVHSGDNGELVLLLPPFACDVQLGGDNNRIVQGDQLGWDPESPEVWQVTVRTSR